MSLPRIVLVMPAGGLRAAISPTHTLSFAVHVFVLTLLIVAPSFGTRKKFAVDAMVVDIVGSVPGAPQKKIASPAANRANAPVQPAPIPKEGVRASKPPALPDPKREKPKKKLEPKVEIPKESVAADAAPVGPGAAPAEADPAKTPGPTAGSTGAAAGGGITSLDAADLEFAWYRAQVTSLLRNRWARPILDDANEPVAATVVFDIRRDGTVGGVRIESSSGIPVMDRSVLRAVLESVPLPPLPASWTDPVLAARYEFRFRPGEP